MEKQVSIRLCIVILFVGIFLGFALSGKHSLNLDMNASYEDNLTQEQEAFLINTLGMLKNELEKIQTDKDYSGVPKQLLHDLGVSGTMCGEVKTHLCIEIGNVSEILASKMMKKVNDLVKEQNDLIDEQSDLIKEKRQLMLREEKNSTEEEPRVLGDVVY